jgi:hypothetical protein
MRNFSGRSKESCISNINLTSKVEFSDKFQILECGIPLGSSPLTLILSPRQRVEREMGWIAETSRDGDLF